MVRTVSETSYLELVNVTGKNLEALTHFPNKYHEINVFMYMFLVLTIFNEGAYVTFKSIFH